MFNSVGLQNMNAPRKMPHLKSLSNQGDKFHQRKAVDSFHPDYAICGTNCAALSVINSRKHL